MGSDRRGNGKTRTVPSRPGCCLPPGELGVAVLTEGPESLGVVGGFEEGTLGQGLEEARGSEVGIPSRVHDPLRESERLRRLIEQGLGVVDSCGFGIRCDAFDESQLLGPLAVDELPPEDEVLGYARAHELHEPRAATEPGQQSDGVFGESEPRIGRRDSDIAGQWEFQSPTHTAPGDGCKHGFLEGLQAIEHLPENPRVRPEFGGRPLGGFLEQRDVGPDREKVVRAGDHGHLYGIRPELVDGFREFEPHRLSDRVDRFVVQSECRHAPLVDRERQSVEGHANGLRARHLDRSPAVDSDSRHPLADTDRPKRTMRFVRFDGDRLGLLTADGDGIIDLTDRLELTAEDPLVEYINDDRDASPYVDASADHDRTDVHIGSPVARPGKVIAAPLNYQQHIEEALADRDIDVDEWFSIKDKGYFLKAPSSVVGPDHGIELPFSDRRVDHEVELAFVIGTAGKDIPAADAWDHVFGYTILLDISVRGQQDRSNRKSYDTFTVIGPCVATPDEVGDPQSLDLRLDLNGETRQDANTADMVYTCADVIQYASIGTTLEVGDVITTGTPAGVSSLADGDVIDATIENVGAMQVGVAERDVRFGDVDVRKGGQQ